MDRRKMKIHFPIRQVDEPAEREGGQSFPNFSAKIMSLQKRLN